MPTWNEYKEIARTRGSLAFELYVVESVANAAPEEMVKTLPAHLDYQRAREEAGQLFLAGPLSDEEGKEMSGGGLIIYRAASLEEAKELANNDPMHAEGKRTYTLRKWLVNEGSLSFSASLSAQSVSLG